MRNFLMLFSVLLLIFNFSLAAKESLGVGSFQFVSENPDEKIQTLVQEPRTIISGFRVVLDSGSSIVELPTLSGTVAQPVYKISIKKCVFFICQTAKLDIEFSLQVEELSAGRLKAVLNGNLNRSSAMISDLYSELQFFIVYQKTESGGELNVRAEVLQAHTFESGIVQSQVKSMLMRQFPAILEAARAVLNGGPVSIESASLSFFESE